MHEAFPAIPGALGNVEQALVEGSRCVLDAGLCERPRRECCAFTNLAGESLLGPVGDLSGEGQGCHAVRQLGDKQEEVWLSLGQSLGISMDVPAVSCPKVAFSNTKEPCFKDCLQ